MTCRICSASPCECPSSDGCGISEGWCCPDTHDPITGQPLPAPGVCAPGPGNMPVPDECYQQSPLVCLQGTVDEARRVLHQAGFRPYRVFLVWQERDARQRYRDVRRVELMPVEISDISAMSWRSAPVGTHADGTVTLTQVSPAQVSEDDLRGRWQGGDPPDGMMFFYEVRRIGRCAGEGERIDPLRFTLASPPALDPKKFEWKVRLTDQLAAPLSPEDAAKQGDNDGTFNPTTGPRREPVIRF